MKLVRKLTLTLVLAITAILAVHGYTEIRREIEHYETDMREDQRIIGRVLRPALTSVWRSQGEARALALLDYADAGLRRVGIRWVWLDVPEGGLGRKQSFPVALIHIPHPALLVGSTGGIASWHIAGWR